MAADSPVNNGAAARRARQRNATSNLSRIRVQDTRRYQSIPKRANHHMANHGPTAVGWETGSIKLCALILHELRRQQDGKPDSDQKADDREAEQSQPRCGEP